MQEITYASSNGENTVYAYIWRPKPEAEIRGVLQLVHGFAEHARRYRDFAEFMTCLGYVVCAHDQLGHGRTADGKFGYIGKNGHKLLAKDTYKFTLLIKKEFNAPIILMGFGAGSLVSRYVCSLWGMEYGGAVFSGTSCGGASINFLYRMFSASKLTPQKGEKEATWVNKHMHNRNGKPFRNSEYGTSWLTRDTAQAAAFEADPLCGFALTYGAGLDLLKLARITNSRGWPSRMPKNLPIYLFSGLDDPIGNFGHGVIKVYGELVGAGCKDIEIRLYEDARHDMLFEMNKHEVYEDIANWLEGVKAYEKNPD